jgi:hypothetical protein
LPCLLCPNAEAAIIAAIQSTSIHLFIENLLSVAFAKAGCYRRTQT